MKKRYVLILVTGLAGLAGTLLYGTKGLAALALLALLTLFRRKKPDEREYQLFYQVGNLTWAVTLLLMLAIFFASGKTVNGHTIGEFWFYLTLFSSLVANGVAGLVLFRE